MAIAEIQRHPRDALHDLLAEWLFGAGGVEAGLPFSWEAARASGWDVAAIEKQLRDAWPHELQVRRRAVDRAAADLETALADPSAPGVDVTIGRVLDAGLTRHEGRKLRRTRLHAALDDVIGIRRGTGYRVCGRCDLVYFYSGRRTSRYCPACTHHKPEPGLLAPGERVRWDAWNDPLNTKLEWIRRCEDCGSEFATTDRRAFYCGACGEGARKVARHRERRRGTFRSVPAPEAVDPRRDDYISLDQAAALVGVTAHEFLKVAVEAGLTGVVRENVVMFHRAAFKTAGWWKDMHNR